MYFVVHHAGHKINLIRYAWSGVQAGCYGDLVSANKMQHFIFSL